MQTETTKKKKKKKENAHTHTHTQQKTREKKDESITVERRGIECRARMRKLCLGNDERFCRKIYIYRNTLIQ
jgi:hypothetical protein